MTRNGSRCPDCARAHEQQRDRQRGSRHERGYGSAWDRVSRLVLERDGHVCQLCGQPGATTADHIVAKANGGSDDPGNLVAAHRVCNSRKGAS